jgi:hypothetical protein
MNSPGLVVLASGGGWAVASLLLPVSAHMVDRSSSAAVFSGAIADRFLGGNVTTEDNAARRHPEDVAAFVNALLTLFLPPALSMLAAFVVPSTSVTVRPERSFFASAWLFLSAFASILIPLVPFSLLAGWRTRVHARRYREGRGSGWQGVLEGGVLGFVAALVVLSRGIATRPREALPYIIVYGGGAALLGLAFGLVLRTSGHIVLKQLGVRSKGTMA